MIASDILIRVAELLLAVVFVLGGIATLRNPQPRAEQLARFRLPFPIPLVRLNAVVMITAGLALALNIMPGLASAVLAAVLVPTTVFGHAFWAAEGTARQEQLAHFIKNLAVLGGLVAMAIAVQ
jgi:putative oxidoreductase